jgi:hypothetical protein
MSKNEFLLPDELGWKCNDELGEVIDDWCECIYKVVKKCPNENNRHALWSVTKAQLMDNMYAVIKKYQSEKKAASKNKAKK